MLPELRDAIRSEATERTWSQGVTLARDGRVNGLAQRGGELELEVRVPGRPTPFEVILETEHLEWECTCGSKEAVCSHVVAAVLAAERTGGELPKPTVAAAPIRYVLSPEAGGVVVERLLVRGDRTEKLTDSLLSLVVICSSSTFAPPSALMRTRPSPGLRHRTSRASASTASRRSSLSPVSGPARPSS